MDTAECAYPGVPRKFFGGSVPVIWQQDERPGNALQPPTGYIHNYGTNMIMYDDIPTASIVTPVDETCPTIAFLDSFNTTISSLAGCPPSVEDYEAILNIDDVPQGPDINMVQTVGTPPDYNTPGTYTFGMYLEDNAGNLSDTLNGIVVTVLPDTINPTFTFVGPDTLALINGNTYVDPGLD